MEKSINRFYRINKPKEPLKIILSSTRLFLLFWLTNQPAFITFADNYFTVCAITVNSFIRFAGIYFENSPEYFSNAF